MLKRSEISRFNQNRALACVDTQKKFKKKNHIQGGDLNRKKEKGV